jgi:hypothetical protein
MKRNDDNLKEIERKVKDMPDDMKVKEVEEENHDG